ncbi:MAG: GTP 3',8-cyclase MoaA [Chloroflexi bacterium]|nr:GTP 3',8-cyclase MoaA [Chloroflexota bacterium]
MMDPFQRTINYLRISVTDKCNLRCVYCMPEEGLPWLTRGELLSYEEITAIVRAIAPMGLKRLRITGGEPLVRRDLWRLVAMLAKVPGIEDIALSTNGVLLAEQAELLAQAGLNRVNVSLDTLRPERFFQIARRNHLPRVLAGLEAADALDLKPIKINTVVMRGVNDDELEELAALTIEHEWHVRFIEVMPLEGNVEFEPQWHISSDEVLERVSHISTLESCQGPPGNGPALYYRFPHGKGTVGVISPLSHNFCDRCNRVRLTSDGQLRLCLFGDQQFDLRTPLRNSASQEELAALIHDAVAYFKPQRHNLDIGKTSSVLVALSQVGG